jgi:hypothetical protein
VELDAGCLCIGYRDVNVGEALDVGLSWEFACEWCQLVSLR